MLALQKKNQSNKAKHPLVHILHDYEMKNPPTIRKFGMRPRTHLIKVEPMTTTTATCIIRISGIDNVQPNNSHFFNNAKY